MYWDGLMIFRQTQNLKQNRIEPKEQKKKNFLPSHEHIIGFAHKKEYGCKS